MEQNKSKLTSTNVPSTPYTKEIQDGILKSENLSLLQDALRDSYIQYKETTARCLI